MVLYDLCFGKNLSNIKYRFIGNIRLTNGYYQSIKDVLLFLFEFSNIRKKLMSSEIKSSNSGKGGKDDIVFKMECQIKEQSRTISDLNNIIMF